MDGKESEKDRELWEIHAHRGGFRTQPVQGVLHGSTTARALLDQLPLTLTFRDYGGQEKVADLPAPLPLEGMPAGSDAQPLTIGYYAPGQALVL